MVMGRMTPPFPENCRLGVPDEACAGEKSLSLLSGLPCPPGTPGTAGLSGHTQSAVDLWREAGRGPPAAQGGWESHVAEMGCLGGFGLRGLLLLGVSF